MNFQNLNFEHVEAPNKWPPQVVQPSTRAPEDDLKSAPSLRPSHEVHRRLGHQVSSPSSISSQATIPPRGLSPSSPTQSTPELHVHGTDSVRGYSGAFQSTPQPPTHENHRALSLSLAARLYESQLAMFAADNTARMNSFKDELTLAAGKVTPGIDDSPYIQYALDALTRERESFLTSDAPVLPPPSNRYSERLPPAQNPKFMVKGFASSRKEPLSNKAFTSPITHNRPAARYESPKIESLPFEREQPLLQPTDYQISTTAGKGQWIPVDKDRLQTVDPRGRTYQPLTFKPRILRPFSMMMLMTFCILMIAGLVFSAVYSQKHHGLTPYPGSIYSGQYFVFRVLPQLLASILLIYAQNIVTASLRIIPFATLAREDPQQRYLALFQSLYPKTFLLPQLSGPWQLKAFGFATWLMNFAMPLHSASFTVIYADNEAKWMWATTKGVIWTLVALYVSLLFATSILMTFWFGHWTGLTWDVRSIADLIPLLHRTNTMSSYRRRSLCGRDCDFRTELRERWFDRLGYWQMEDMTTGGIWHTIGTSTMPVDHHQQQQQRASSGDNWVDGYPERLSNELSVNSHQTESSGLLDFEGGSYLPWSLRSLPLITYVLVTGSLLLALIIVSFLPQTRLEAGFAPLLVAKPNGSAFSAANFLYSFLPATLGMVLFLLFQSPDRALRILQPWSDMGEVDGALASRSILADYAACLPFQVSWKALRNGHWRVAIISLMSTLFIFIPILAGGLFMALTAPNQQVRMFPNMSVFGVLLAFLVLYVGCLFILIPYRQQFRLPHSVETIASLISFCTAKDLCEDAAFRSVRSRTDLMDRLGVGRQDHREESVWFFGLLAGRDEKRISVRRMQRYTEKMTMTRSMNAMV